jgi:Heparinase II/III-like protein/Heparinase II/III N-terminus
MGPHWTSGIELGLRVTSFVWTRRLLTGWSGVAALFEDNPVFVTSLGQHQLWLAKFTSIGSSANNHAVAEASGQFCAATAFPWFAESAQWRKESARFLHNTVEALTFPGGINSELASHYHLFTLELVLTALLEDAYSGAPALHSDLDDAAVRMCDAMAAIIDSTGTLPRQGDSDDASVIGFDRVATTPLQTLAFAAGVVDPLPWWPTLPSDSRGMYVHEAVRLAARSSRPAEPPFFFADAGTVILQRQSSRKGQHRWFRFDFGPHGGTSIGAHSHADALSIEFRIDGIDLIADAGTFRYSDPMMRSYYRGTAAHSTIQIDGKDQSTSGGPFLWTTAAATNLIEHREEPDGSIIVSAAHTGYADITHQRHIRGNSDLSQLTITDELIGTEGRLVTSRFLLGPEIEVDLTDRTAVLRSSGNVLATMALADSLTWTIETGIEGGTEGWYSPSYGLQVPTRVLRGKGVTPLASTVTTITLND